MFDVPGVTRFRAAKGFEVGAARAVPVAATDNCE